MKAFWITYKRIMHPLSFSWTIALKIYKLCFMLFTHVYKSLKSHVINDFYGKQTLPRDRWLQYLIHTNVNWCIQVFQKLKNVRKSRFYSSKNYTNPCEHSEEILGQKKLCEYLLISHVKSFLNIPPVNILYTNVEIKTCLDFFSKQTNITGLHSL